MDALDQLTLRKRRDRLLNPIVAPLAVLEEAMFVHQVPPAFVFAAQPPAPPPPPPPQPPPPPNGLKRERDEDDSVLLVQPPTSSQRTAPPRGEKRGRPAQGLEEVLDEPSKGRRRVTIPPQAAPLVIDLSQPSRAPRLPYPAGYSMFTAPMSRSGAAAA